MGWKPGQGVGPRITYKQLRAQEGRPIAPGEALDDQATKHLYAPRDTKPILYLKKDNAHGLGYVPGEGLFELNGAKAGQGAETGPNISGRS